MSARRLDPSESSIQRAVVRWFDLQHRELGVDDERLLHAVPNGGARSPVTAAILKAEGARAGAPDLELDVARGGYHGLRIELKTATGRLRPEQATMLNALTAGGYLALVCRSFDEATGVIRRYISLDVPR